MQRNRKTRWGPPRERTDIHVGPHDFRRRGWRLWICDHCFAPRALHPRTNWVRSRPQGENSYLSTAAPHFKEGW